MIEINGVKFDNDQRLKEVRLILVDKRGNTLTVEGVPAGTGAAFNIDQALEDYPIFTASVPIGKITIAAKGAGA